MRVRLGYGPSGEAAAERRVIEVHDVFADKDLEDWQEVASELQFRSLVALPLQTGKGTTGAVTFYFAGTGAPTPETRGLLRIVADQMAATAEKASLIDELRRANVALRESNEELEQQVRGVLDSRRAQDDFLATVAQELRGPLTAIHDRLRRLREAEHGPLPDGEREDLGKAEADSEHLLVLVEDLLDLTTQKRHASALRAEEFDPRDVVRDVASVAQVQPGGSIRLEVPDGLVPQMKSDRQRVTRIVASLLSNVLQAAGASEVVLDVAVRGDHAVFRVRTGVSSDAPAPAMEGSGRRDMPRGTTGVSGLGLSRRLAHLLGGDIFIDAVPGAGTTMTVELPLELDPGGPDSASRPDQP
ncbi:MAG: GAF domain-containing sensor histidine kinase [Gemmatimonadaceae bacterium]